MSRFAFCMTIIAAPFGERRSWIPTIPVESQQARRARVREPVLARLGLVLEVLERPHDPEPDQRATAAREKLPDGRRCIAVALTGVEEACVAPTSERRPRVNGVEDLKTQTTYRNTVSSSGRSAHCSRPPRRPLVAPVRFDL